MKVNSLKGAMLLALVVLTVNISAFAQSQWSPSGEATGNIYYNGGNVGIGTSTPNALLDVGGSIKNLKLGVVLGRLPEGNTTGEGTFLGVRGFATQQDEYSGKSFAIEHSFYGWVNNSINFFRGSNEKGGFMTFNTNTNQEQMRITANGNVGIGTSIPSSKLSVAGSTYLSNPVGRTLMLERDDADSWITFHDPNNSWYSMGIDASDGGKFKMNWGGEPGHESLAHFVMTQNGNIGIGTTNPGAPLTVNGLICAKEVKVSLSGTPCWPDYVFSNTYSLRPLSEVESFIKENKHLPEVPSATEVEKNGVHLGEMDALLLKKIEELTLYMIEQKKEIEEVKNENKDLKEINKTLEIRIQKLEK